MAGMQLMQVCAQHLATCIMHSICSVPGVNKGDEAKALGPVGLMVDHHLHAARPAVDCCLQVCNVLPQASCTKAMA